MFNFMKKDKTDKRDKKERKDAKRPLSRDLFGAVSSSSSSSSAAAAAVAGSATPSGAEKLTADELHRLDEVRRSLKIRTRRKEKEKLPSGITADYTANLGLNIDGWPDDDKTVQLGSPTSDGSASSEVASLSSLTTKSDAGPTVPPSRGILKGKSSYGLDAASCPAEALDDDTKLVENTLRNELIIYEKPPSVLKPPAAPKRPHDAEPAYSVPRLLGRVATPEPGVVPALVYERKPPTEPPPPPPPATPPKASPRDADHRPFVWPQPPGEGSGWFDHHRLHHDAESTLRLPSLGEPVLPDARQLVVQRKETGDFGFSLRRSVVVERPSNDPSRYISCIKRFKCSSVFIGVLRCRSAVKRTVIFAEPVGGATGSSLLNYRQQDASDALALLPGDRLLEVNGENVQDKSREEIIDIIRHSGSSVALRVSKPASNCRATGEKSK